jgi:tRNA-Thr(GGU) m(6)t(6)A37 methyltransferase TsaA
MSGQTTDRSSDFEPRPGEVALDLPPPDDAALRFIGHIETPWRTRADCPKNSAEANAICTVVVDPDFAKGLHGLESCSHLWLIYWMDRSPRNLILQRPRHYQEARGVFALRSPVRPNPLALSAVRLIDVDANRLRVVGVDCIDGTRLIDIKPYFPSTDSHPDATVGWHQREKAQRQHDG